MLQHCNRRASERLARACSIVTRRASEGLAGPSADNAAESHTLNWLTVPNLEGLHQVEVLLRAHYVGNDILVLDAMDSSEWVGGEDRLRAADAILEQVHVVGQATGVRGAPQEPCEVT